MSDETIQLRVLTDSRVWIYFTKRAKNKSVKPSASCTAGISEGCRTKDPQFHIFISRSMPSVSSINTSVCIHRFLILFFFPDAFQCSPFTPTHSPPSSSTPLTPHPSISPSIYPSIPFGGTLSGTLGLFIKASKPTASNTQPLERQRGRWRVRWRNKEGTEGMVEGGDKETTKNMEGER